MYKVKRYIAGAFVFIVGCIFGAVGTAFYATISESKMQIESASLLIVFNRFAANVYADNCEHKEYEVARTGTISSIKTYSKRLDSHESLPLIDHSAYISSQREIIKAHEAKLAIIEAQYQKCGST